MSHQPIESHELINALSGVVALCDVTLSQLGNRARARRPLMMIREAAQRLLSRPSPDPAPDSEALPERTVLVMDDDALSLLTVEHQLRSLGLLVLAAQSPEMAEKLVKLVDGRIDVLFWGLRRGERPPERRCKGCEDLIVAYLSDEALPEQDHVLERPVEADDVRRLLRGLFRDEVDTATA